MKETLAFRIAVLYRDFLAYTTGELKKLGLSFGLMPILIYTGKHPGCTQSELTRALQLDWGYSQRSVSRLAEEGFLTKAPDARTACNCLTLTEKGDRAFDVSHRVFTDWDSRKLASFSPEEKDALLTLLQRLIA